MVAVHGVIFLLSEMMRDFSKCLHKRPVTQEAITHDCFSKLTQHVVLERYSRDFRWLTGEFSMDRSSEVSEVHNNKSSIFRMRGTISETTQREFQSIQPNIGLSQDYIGSIGRSEGTV